MRTGFKLVLALALVSGVLAADSGHSASSAPAADSAHGAATPVLPGDALKRLLEGNARFVKGEMAHPNQSKERRELVAKGQNPFAIILTCADSRVAPEFLFDQGIGDLFVIRNAGNVLDDHVLGSIEYAVEHLNVGLIVALGHSQCGAAKATLGGGHAPGHVGSILASMKPALETSRGEPGDKLANLIKGNVENVAFYIEKSDPLITKAVAQGRVRVVGATYDLASGKVEWVKKPEPRLTKAK